jgi:two-component system KDP operon response regulator KdpE
LQHDGQLRVALIGANAEHEADRWASEEIELELSSTIGDAVRKVRERPPDAAIIYASNALAAEWCTVLRQLGDFAIGVLPESLTEETAIGCLEAGADFALTQPVPPAEVIARIRAAVRRNVTTPVVVETGTIRIDLTGHVVTRNGTLVPMTRTEFRVLAALAARLGEVVPAADLLRAAWGDEFVSEVHYVRLYVGYLRSKLEDDPSHPRLIVTHRLQGYRLSGG